MGWQRMVQDWNDPWEANHEGYVVAVVPDTERGYGWIEAKMDDEHLVDQPISYMQVACACGWRSPVMLAPSDTTYMRWCIALDNDVEDTAGDYWASHHMDLPQDLPRPMVASR